MAKIRVLLGSGNMGDVEAADFDAWAGFVVERIGEAVGFFVAEVDQRPFGQAGEDQGHGATEEQAAAIRRWLSAEGWDAFCGEEWARRGGSR